MVDNSNSNNNNNNTDDDNMDYDTAIAFVRDVLEWNDGDVQKVHDETDPVKRSKFIEWVQTHGMMGYLSTLTRSELRDLHDFL